jgi:hypothetical protein
MSSPGLLRTPRPRSANSPPLPVLWQEKSQQLIQLDPNAASAIGGPMSYENLDRIEDHIAAILKQRAAAVPEISPALTAAIEEMSNLERRYMTAQSAIREQLGRLRRRTAAEKRIHNLLQSLPADWEADLFPELAARGSRWPRFADFAEARSAIEKMQGLVFNIETRFAVLRDAIAVFSMAPDKLNTLLILHLAGDVERLKAEIERLRNIPSSKRKR